MPEDPDSPELHGGRKDPQAEVRAGSHQNCRLHPAVRYLRDRGTSDSQRKPSTSPGRSYQFDLKVTSTPSANKHYSSTSSKNIL